MINTNHPQFARVQTAYDVPLLAQSRVVVVGTGGARGLVEDLARTGIGEIGLIDPDVSSVENVGTQAAIKNVDFGFEAPDLKIKAGTTVVFKNTGERPHTATDRGGTFDTQPLDPGASGSVTFSVPGTYAIFCRINPSKMNGAITVEPGVEPAKVVRVQALDDGNIAGEKLRFDPTQVSVKSGTTLLFANVGGKPHSLTAEDGSFSTGIVQPGPEKGRFPGTNATLTLNKPGTFNFFCDIHPQVM